jgi:D-lactate dehydrogenase (cytochrome)
MDALDLAGLAGLLDDPERCSVSPYALETHARDESFCPPRAPDAVVWPRSTAEVSRVLAWANERRVPVTAWGGGSSLEGNPIPARGGISLDMAQMNAVLEIWPGDWQARVQPGIVGDELNRILAPHGLFFPVLPSSSNIATLGGMIANNAGGIHAVKYGGIREYLLALEVVLASGEIIRTGSRSLKTAAGYDLGGLFVGSEGTLGVITEAVLRLRPLPEHRLTCLAGFAEVHQAVEAAQDVLGSGLEPAALELMEPAYVRLVNRAKGLGWPDQALLIIELHRPRPGWADAQAELAELCADRGGAIIEAATTRADSRRIWEGRGGVRPAVRALLPGMGIIAGDVGLPISQIPGFIAKSAEVAARYGLEVLSFAHVGDGNLHTWTLYAEADPDSLARAQAAEREMVGYALELGGTVTAEHGLGAGYKREFLLREHPSSTPLMRSLKRLLDPAGILNPGKVFPEESGIGNRESGA